MGLIPGSGGSPGGRHGNPLQDSYLENPMDSRTLWLQSIGSQRVRHNWSNLACNHACKLHRKCILLNILKCVYTCVYYNKENEHTSIPQTFLLLHVIHFSYPSPSLIYTDLQTGLSDFTFHFHALEKEMATHSNVLAWRVPGMAEPRGLPSIGSHRVGHDWSDLAAAAVTIDLISIF